MSTENTDLKIAPIDGKDFGLEAKDATEIAGKFTPSIVERDALAEIYGELITKELTPETAIEARDLRLKFVKVRTGISSIHKTQKAFYLAGGKFVDAWKNKETEPVTLMEEKLKEIEDHQANIEKAKIEELAETRIKELNAIGCFDIPEGIGGFSQSVYDSMYKGLKLEQEEKQAAEKKAEEERIESERTKLLAMERGNKLAPYDGFRTNEEIMNTPSLREMKDDDFNKLLASLIERKKKHDDEQEEIRKENARLREEAEKKEAKEKKEREEREEEANKKQALRAERSVKLDGLMTTMPAKFASVDYTELTFKEFENMLVEAKAAKADQDIRDEEEAFEKQALQDKVDKQEAAEKEEAKKEKERAKQGDKGILNLCVENLEKAKISGILESENGEIFKSEINGSIQMIINRIKPKK